jgi:hypothetical protein
MQTSGVALRAASFGGPLAGVSGLGERCIEGSATNSGSDESSLRS